MEKEIRCNPVSFRVSKDKKTLSGYAARFNSDSEDLGGFVERIAPGAFKEALRISDTRCLINHNQDLILGRVSAGTLRLKEDDRGLYMSVDLPDTSYARDLAKSLERGDISQQSFAFKVAEDRFENLDDPDKTTVRTIERVSHLYDVSPVTYPAYPQTSVALRSMAMARAKDTDDPLLEQLLYEDMFADFDLLLNDL
jgi:HK97 family phage prohead protease